MNTKERLWKLSPSDFAYLYEDCKLCYCLKIKHGISLPSMPMPGVFSTTNSLMQGNIIGKNLREISPNLPDGEVVKQEGFVKSVPIPATSVFIGGKYDLLVKNRDETYTIVDLKISKPSDGKAEMYQSQLWSYQYALENPSEGAPIKISKLALLIFYPESVSFVDGAAKLSLPPQWVEVTYDHDKFVGFIKGVDSLLSGPLPSEGENCKWCAYRHKGEEISHHLQAAPTGDEPPF